MNFAWKVFLAVALVYAFFSAFTTVFYKGKSITSLSISEIEILRGEATISSRATVFFVSLFSSVIAPPVYGVSLVIIGIYSLAKHFLF